MLRANCPDIYTLWCVQYDDDRTKHETISQTEPKINSSWNEDDITRLSLLAWHNWSSSMELGQNCYTNCSWICWNTKQSQRKSVLGTKMVSQSLYLVFQTSVFWIVSSKQVNSFETGDQISYRYPYITHNDHCGFLGKNVFR